MSHDIQLIEDMFQITSPVTWLWRKQASTAVPEIGWGECVTAFQNVGFSPHLGAKGFSTVPVLDVSLFLLDFVHKIHQNVISLVSFYVGTVRHSRSSLHRSYLYIDLNSREMPVLLYHMSFPPRIELANTWHGRCF